MARGLSGVEDLKVFRMEPADFNDESLRFHWQIDIKPTGDHWLLARERTWEEVDEVLEGRLQSIQKSFIEIDGDHPPDQIALAYGIDRPIGNNLSRVLAYSEMIDEYRVVVASNQRRVQKKRQDYEAHKASLDEDLVQKRISYAQHRLQLQEFWNQDQGIVATECTPKIKQANKMQQLIYRKAVMDFFSLSTDEASKTPLVVENIAKLYGEAIFIGDPTAHGQIKKREPVSTFFTGLTDYLATTTDKSLLRHYTYRHSPNIINREEDCAVLNPALIMALGDDHPLADVAPGYHLLGQAYYKFLVSQAVFISGSKGFEGYPIIALIYDSLTTAVFSDDIAVMRSVAGLIDTNLQPYARGDRCCAEVRALGKRTAKRKLLLRDQEVDTPPSGYDPIHPNENIKAYITDDEITLSTAIKFYNLLISRYRELLPLKTSRFVEALIADIKSAEKSASDSAHKLAGEPTDTGYALMQAYDTVYQQVLISGYFRRVSSSRNLIDGLLSLNRGLLFPVEADPQSTRVLSTFMGKLNIEHGALVAKAEKLEILKSIQEKRALCQEQDQPLYDNEIIKLYLNCFFAETVESLIETKKENDSLRREVIDNSVWFVSPRGDRFSVRNDPELTDYGVASITFTIDKTCPREYQVFLQVEGLSDPLVFWLDKNGEVVGRSHEPLVCDVGFKERLENLLLKRLYTITSGILAEEEDPEPGTAGGPSFSYTRAHYDLLVSTPGRRITMESHGAETHAREIKEEYGIDIFEEIRRRRARGTLEQNQFITFSREHIPDVVQHPLLPNELIYDPSQVKIQLSRSTNQ
ncbi:MAG: hypothetical protein WCV93_04135 [Candidatus Shapirobacteria bacterium]|jgi:hypothetical protein